MVAVDLISKVLMCVCGAVLVLFNPLQLQIKAKRHTVGQDRQKCKETSNLDLIIMHIDTSGLADKHQKTGEHVENIKFS